MLSRSQEKLKSLNSRVFSGREVGYAWIQVIDKFRYCGPACFTGVPGSTPLLSSCCQWCKNPDWNTTVRLHVLHLSVMGIYQVNTSRFTSMDRNACISASVLVMINVMVTIQEMLCEGRLWLDLRLWRNLWFLAQVDNMGKTDLRNLYLNHCPLKETSDQCLVYWEEKNNETKKHLPLHPCFPQAQFQPNTYPPYFLVSASLIFIQSYMSSVQIPLVRQGAVQEADVQILVCSSESLSGLLFELAPLPLSMLPVHCSPSGVSMDKCGWPMRWSPSGMSFVLTWHVAVGDLQPNAHTHTHTSVCCWRC